MSESTEEIVRQMREQASLARQIHDSPDGPQKWVGRAVKKGFATTGEFSLEREYMWVEVVAVEGGRLKGKLCNQPFYAIHLQRGDTVLLDEDEIVSVAE